VFRRVRDYIRQHQLFVDADRVLVGFSGGADSTALLLLVADLAPVTVGVHLHHGLRGDDADRDAEWCRAFCAARGFRFECHRLDVPGHLRPGENLEAGARRLRLAAWQRLADERASVALGHHADDAVEDLLMRLARGANASGLTSLRPVRVLEGVRIIRPLLCLRRVQIESFLRDSGVNDWCVDATNEDVTLLRNAVRHEWLPSIRQAVGHDTGLTRSLDALRLDADYLAAAANEVVADVDSRSKLARIHPALLPRALRMWLSEKLGRDMVLPRSAIERLRAELARGAAGRIEVPVNQDVVLVLSGDSLTLKREPRRLLTRRWHWRSQPVLDLSEVDGHLAASVVEGGAAVVDVMSSDVDQEYFDCAAVPEQLEVRAWQPGDRLIPFGSRSCRKVQDLFVDSHVPRERRHEIPVLVADGQIIWVAGVRRAEFGRLADAAAVRVQWRSGAVGQGGGSVS